MLVRWLLTVFSAIPRRSLISAVGSPADTSERIWTSRSVSGSPLRARRGLRAGERLMDSPRGCADGWDGAALSGPRAEAPTHAGRGRPGAAWARPHRVGPRPCERSL